MKRKTILIADSGSTKTDWAVIGKVSQDSLDGHFAEANVISQFQTQGLNPVLMDETEMIDILRSELLHQLTEPIESLWFYGAGVRDDQQTKMQRVFTQAFAESIWDVPFAVYTASDMLGAARALCGHSEGIACILGTGANSCLFDGEQIIANTPALGFILGDEGGGAALGKRFLNAIFKGLLPASLRDEYLSATHFTLSEIIRRVYSEPMANKFLASTSTFIAQHIDNEDVKNMVVDNFRQFFSHNIVPYGRRDLPVSFVGSIAYYYEPQLREAAAEEGFVIGQILKTPIEALCSYHSA